MRKLLVLALVGLVVGAALLASDFPDLYGFNIFLGRDLDEDVVATVDLASGDETAKWSTTNNRFELSDDLLAQTLTVGTGTAVDRCYTVDLDTDQTICWDEAQDRFEISNDLLANTLTVGVGTDASTCFTVDRATTDKAFCWDETAGWFDVDDDFQATTLTIGTGTDASRCVTIDRATTDETWCWDETDGRFEFSDDLQATSLTTGVGTDVDSCWTVDLAAADETVCWAEAADRYEISQDAIIADTSPLFGFDDTDATNTTTDGSFQVQCTDVTSSSEDCPFDFFIRVGGTFTRHASVTGEEDTSTPYTTTGYLGKLLSITTVGGVEKTGGLISYTGVRGTSLLFENGENSDYSFEDDALTEAANTYDLGSTTYTWRSGYFATHLYADAISDISGPGTNFTIDTSGNATFAGTVKGASLNITGTTIILRSPDASCSQCGPDNLDIWTCAPVACP